MRNFAMISLSVLLISPLVLASGGGGGSSGSVPPQPMVGNPGTNGNNDDGSLRVSTAGYSKGQNLTIKAGETLIVDESVELGILTIESSGSPAVVQCPTSSDKNFNTLNPIVLTVQGIEVKGSKASLICGSNTNPYTGAGFHIEVVNGASIGMMGPMTIASMSGGSISLFGQKTDKWLRLNKTANVNDREITIERAVNWNVGDEIVIATTSFDRAESEVRIIENVKSSGRVLELDRPLSFSHHGELQTFTGLQAGIPTTLDLRAEVANLSRNIKIYSQVNGSIDSLDYNGAHMMAMNGGRAFIDNVEFRYMGRMGKLGRYPFHWHLLSDVPGQFIRNSSVRDSFQRCIVIHETNDAEVVDNVCHNHFAHGIFMEEGTEVRNRITGNLVIGGKRVLSGRQLLQSELLIPAQFERFSAPAAYWISNPENTVEDNVAVGSQGTGFWNSFTQRRDIYRRNTTAFNNNVAKANAVGINWDGTEDGPLTRNPNNPDKDFEIVNFPYSPSTKNPTFSGLVAAKNHFSGIYFRGNTVTFDKAIVADNGFSIWVTSNQIIKDSLVIGRSASTKDTDYAFIDALTRGPKRRQMGVRIYDGPINLENVAFVGYPRTLQGRYTPVPFGEVNGAERHYNYINNVQFIPSDPEKFVQFPLVPAQYIPNVESIYDEQGVIAPMQNQTIVNDHPILWDPSSCVRDDARFDGAFACDYRIGFFHMWGRNAGMPLIEYTLTRISADGSERVQASTRPGEGIFDNGFKKHIPVILDRGYRYELRFNADVRFGDYRAMFSTVDVSGRTATSPIIKAIDSAGEVICFTIEANSVLNHHHSNKAGAQRVWGGFPGNNASCNF